MRFVKNLFFITQHFTDFIHNRPKRAEIAGIATAVLSRCCAKINIFTENMPAKRTNVRSILNSKETTKKSSVRSKSQNAKNGKNGVSTKE